MEERLTDRFGALAASFSCALAVISCGGSGSTSSPQDSGSNKTYLSVSVSDPDGDPLQYQWRVTGGTVQNVNAAQTVWTMPDGPGLHFAYVRVSDGKGGYAEQQYAVSSDALGTNVAAHATISRAAPAVVNPVWNAGRLRFQSADTLSFAVGDGTLAQRVVYLADVAVQVTGPTGVVFSGNSDTSGEVNLSDLAVGPYTVKCSSTSGGPLVSCGPGFTVNANPIATAMALAPPQTASNNLRVFGHVALSDGGTCGSDSEYFSQQSAATVQLQAVDGSALSVPTRVNRFGDYEISVAALAHGQYQAKVSCEGYTATVAIAAPTDPLGYVGVPVEVSHKIANARPAIVKMVANGPDGNVRGQMVVPLAGQADSLPGALQFLTFKGRDTKLGACQYYTAIGAAGGCDANGNMVDPITLDDWKRQHQLAPYAGANAQVAATYINRMDLNLVRRMYATQTAANNVAFLVCNHPGPNGSTQEEIDQVIDTGLSDQKQIACVAMEWSTVAGVNGGLPFTKFLTFGPDGGLLLSINLDQRGEKYMPGTCVACHGGTQYAGRFAESAKGSAFLGSSFLAFDTGNYLFSTAAGLTEASQTQSFYDLNQLVKATDVNSANKSTTRLIDGWYHAGATTTLDHGYVPTAWVQAEAQGATGASTLYKEVVGGVCRTCHAAMGTNAQFDWDSNPAGILNNGTANAYFCGGKADVLTNASMPNALISRNRLSDRIQADPNLSNLMQTYLGCVTPAPDPVYSKR